ncbi:MAG: hypothetical protein KA766_14045 [Piscinibacter sp.]|uniref:hypothetical protein n=1 Tax=Piscinibacter sp. TaxID=1903157 RepID=UPI0011D5D4C2|nr:hypothetical protein [Piscinibacter sp.]MBP5991122.1 hypothetical protein [Piscinibacter sp.]MBP6028334.1 hypothetical protein [Piscinibacter sp.]TXH61651.1 MAG: hypothetical protein E6Q93_04515 [Burkholderiaceae bacterium]
MSVFSICTSFVAEGQLRETLSALASAESEFTLDKGVLFRMFVQCTIQPHVIWTVTEWTSEKHHNDAAQSIMKTRRDDRIASIQFGPEPYFEIFCNEESGLRVGEYSDLWRHIVVAHGLVGTKARREYSRLRSDRVARLADKIPWLRVYHNRYNVDEFVALLGFRDELAFGAVRDIEGFRLEEYLFTGLRKPLGMSYLANYNQFVCGPLSLGARHPGGESPHQPSGGSAAGGG